MDAREARRRGAWGAWLGAAAAAPLMKWLWGFSVDDAFITARVAAHIANGFGHRFNTHGPIVDAVTPFGFAYVLAPFSARGPLAAMYFAKWFGAACGVLSAAWLGRAIAVLPGSRARFLAFAPLAASAPFAAWCVSGMETGVVVLLTTLALSAARAAPLAAGVAAALRPELVPYSVALSVGRALAARRTATNAAWAFAAACAPAIAVAMLRVLFFGHAAPLAVWAKPSDFEHGARYLAVCLIWTGAPLLVLSPAVFRRLDHDGRAVLAAVAAHCLALVLAGGDWMALCRFFVPVVPALVLVGARLGALTRPGSTAARAGAATLVCAVLSAKQGPVARGVLDQRLRLIREARPALTGAHRIAAVDVGWVGAATDADVVDLAGVTDEVVARLPGGHTSKRLPSRFIENRDVDALVLLCAEHVSPDCREGNWDRAVEYRAASQAAELGFTLTAELELHGTAKRYLIFRKRDPE